MKRIDAPTGRPRKYTMPVIKHGKHATGDVIRGTRADGPEMRAEIEVMAARLDERGWIECAGRLYVTEAMTRKLEIKAEKQVRAYPERPVPGFYAEWERTVGVYTFEDGHEELSPVVTMFAVNPAESDEAAAERFTAVAQEHGIEVGRL